MSYVDPFFVVIPARYGSTRLKGKPLLDICGKPMIQHVYEQAKKSRAEEVLVATDDQRIFDAVKSFGGNVCITRADHVSGTDRLQEVAKAQNWPDDAIVVNVQGDEPLMPSAVINQVALNLAKNSAAAVATLSEAIENIEVFLDPNAVKVVRDQQGFALYFSRAPIPWPRDAFKENRNSLPNDLLAQRHIGIYAYRVGFLNQFIHWPPADIEKIESLEQLRALANGIKIHVEQALEPVPGGVDTEADLQALRSLLENRKDSL